MGMAEDYMEFLDERRSRIAADKSLEATAQALIDEATSSPIGSETCRLLVDMPEAIAYSKRAIEMLKPHPDFCPCWKCKTASEALEKIKAVMG